MIQKEMLYSSKTMENWQLLDDRLSIVQSSKQEMTNLNCLNWTCLHLAHLEIFTYDLHQIDMWSNNKLTYFSMIAPCQIVDQWSSVSKALKGRIQKTRVAQISQANTHSFDIWPLITNAFWGTKNPTWHRDSIIQSTRNFNSVAITRCYSAQKQAL